jgi:hypothetical protein
MGKLLYIYIINDEQIIFKNLKFKHHGNHYRSIKIIESI